MRPTLRVTLSVCRAIALCSIAFAGAAAAQQPATFRETITAYRASHDDKILRELSNFLAIPNLASDRTNIRRNAEHLLALMKAHGVQGQLLESPSGAPPVVYGELKVPGATKTIVLYAH